MSLLFVLLLQLLHQMCAEVVHRPVLEYSRQYSYAITDLPRFVSGTVCACVRVWWGTGCWFSFMDALPNNSPHHILPPYPRQGTGTVASSSDGGAGSWQSMQ